MKQLRRLESGGHSLVQNAKARVEVNLTTEQIMRLIVFDLVDSNRIRTSIS